MMRSLTKLVGSIMLHKTHYEVFDKTGRKHLGEANLEGTIDSGKADPSKHLDIR